METIMQFVRLQQRAVLMAARILLLLFPFAAQAQLSINITSTDASCPEGIDGVAKVNVTGGVLPYSFHWSNGSNSREITALVPNAYSVTVTDALGATGTASTAIQLTGGESLLVLLNEPYCLDQTMTFTAEAGYSNYQWTLNNPADVILSGQGTYAITVQWSAAGPKQVEAQFSSAPSQCSGVTYFKAQVEACTGTQAPDASGLQVAPNPFERNIAVHTAGNETSDFTLQLMDLCGNQIASQRFYGSEAVLETPELPQGQYLLWYQNEHSRLVKKVIKN